MNFTIYTDTAETAETAETEEPGKKAWSFHTVIDNQGDLRVEAVDADKGTVITTLFWVTAIGIEGDSSAGGLLEEGGYDTSCIEFSETGATSADHV